CGVTTREDHAMFKTRHAVKEAKNFFGTQYLWQRVGYLRHRYCVLQHPTPLQCDVVEEPQCGNSHRVGGGRQFPLRRKVQLIGRISSGPISSGALSKCRENIETR